MYSVRIYLLFFTFCSQKNHQTNKFSIRKILNIFIDDGHCFSFSSSISQQCPVSDLMRWFSYEFVSVTIQNGLEHYVNITRVRIPILSAVAEALAKFIYLFYIWRWFEKKGKTRWEKTISNALCKNISHHFQSLFVLSCCLFVCVLLRAKMKSCVAEPHPKYSNDVDKHIHNHISISEA